MLADIRVDVARSQDDIVHAFEQGKVGGVPAPVRRIDTPLNHVFLSGQFAYKLKRSIEMPFVDFRDAAARRRACESELAVNRALGSPLYRRVMGVLPTEGGFALGSCEVARDVVALVQ